MANADRIIHVSKTLDPSTRLPLVVIDSTALPSSDSQHFNQCVSRAIGKLPKSNHVLLFFACGAPNKPSWSWVAKTYAMLERPTKKRIKKIYVVHESWWVRAMIEMLRGVVSSKFKGKIVHVSNLSQLAQLIDITMINIRPSVYLHDRKIREQITVPRNPTPVFGFPLSVGQDGTTAIVPQVWSELMTYLYVVGPNTDKIFRPTDSPELLCILRDCFDRNQLVDLDDYGPYLAASALKLYLYQLPSVVLPVNAIRLPIQDTAEYCEDIFKSLNTPSTILISELMDLLVLIVANQLKTHQTPSTLAASIGPSLIGLSAISKESISIGVRYTRNLIEYWSDIRPKLKLHDLHGTNKGADIISSASSTMSGLIYNDPNQTKDVQKSRIIPPPVPPARGTVKSTMPPPQLGGNSSLISPTIALPSASTSSLPFLHSRNISTPELHSRYREGSIEAEAAVGVVSGSGNVRSVSATGDIQRPHIQRSLSKSPIKINSSQRTAMQTPPLPPPKPIKLSDSMVLQPIQISNVDPNTAGDKTVQSPVRKFGPRSKSVVSTGRGKMVAELAKLYEERSQSAQILVSIDRKRNE